MRGMSKIALALIIIIVAAFAIFFIIGFTYGRIVSSAQFFEGTTNLMLVSQASSGEGEVECKGLNLIVLYKEGQIKEGDYFMGECGLSMINCDPEPVDLKYVTLDWELGNYYTGSGVVGSEILHQNDVKLVSCGEVFDPVQVKITTEEFVIDKIPAKVTMHSPAGTTWDEWEVTYISGKGLI